MNIAAEGVERTGSRVLHEFSRDTWFKLNDPRTTLERAFDKAYAAQEITDNAATHDRESSTVRDVLEILATVSTEPEEYIVRADVESGEIAADGVWLLGQLRSFTVEGQFTNLGRASEFEIRDESLIYLDLAQQGG